MKKILVNQMKKIETLARKVSEESLNTASAYLYYEPKSPNIIKKNKSNK